MMLMDASQMGTGMDPNSQQMMMFQNPYMQMLHPFYAAPVDVFYFAPGAGTAGTTASALSSSSSRPRQA